MTPVETLHDALTRSDAPSRAELLDTVSTFLEFVSDDSFDFEDDEDGIASDLVRAIYWAMYDCHGGMWSREYALACRCSGIYRPGMGEVGPEEESSAWDYYQAMCYPLPESST